MTIDNFSQISHLIKFDSEDDFYFLQIIQRKKEHEELNSNNRVIKSYYIKSVDHLLKMKDEIVKLCDVFNARAYINLNKRSFEKCALYSMKSIADRIINKQFVDTPKTFNTVCGQLGANGDKIWIVDFDGQDDRFINSSLNFIERECEPIGNKFIAIIPTKNGKHLIVKPFNLQTFKEAYPEIDVHKNNPTILYVNK